MEEMSYPEPTRSPRRQKIMALVENKQMTAAQIGEAFGISRDAAYGVLLKMEAANQVKKYTRSNQAFWGKYEPPQKVEREPRVHAGTMTEPLSLAYMHTPTRPGAMDAYSIKSRGMK